MKRSKIPKAPAGVKISPVCIRSLAWYAKTVRADKYASHPSITLSVDGFWTTPITIYSSNWRSKGKKGISIGYGSGGANESDNFDYLRNFTAALQYAIELVDWLGSYFAHVESTVDNLDKVV